MIEARGLTVTTPGGRRLVDGVDLALATGARHALVGSSGAGKTTLALAVVGVWPQGLRVEGSARLAGQELIRAGERARRRARRGHVAVLGQDPGSALTPTRSVGAAIAELAPGAVDVAALLAEVGLDPALAGRRPTELSGGQQRRVALARALAARPRLLVVDEPTAGLDPTARDLVLDLLEAVVSRRGLTLLLVTHDLEAATRLSCDLSTVCDGALVTGCAREVVPAPPVGAIDGRPVLRATGLEVVVPGTQDVLAVGDLELREGVVTTLAGPSGVGKSTLARALTGFAPARGGTLEIGGRALALDQRDRAARDRRRIQLVHQDSVDALNPHVEIGRAIGRALPGPRPDRRRRVGELLRDVALDDDVRTRRPHQLSGGQRQRVILARTLASDPDVLICDETTANLDARARDQVIDLLGRTARRGRAVFVLTHDPAVIARGQAAYVIAERRLTAVAAP